MGKKERYAKSSFYITVVVSFFPTRLVKDHPHLGSLFCQGALSPFLLLVVPIYNVICMFECGVYRNASIGSLYSFWAAHFPLPGLIQSAPCAEGYALVLLVSNVAQGKLYVASDSLINIDLVSKVRVACLKPSNSGV